MLHILQLLMMQLDHMMMENDGWVEEGFCVKYQVPVGYPCTQLKYKRLNGVDVLDLGW